MVNSFPSCNGSLSRYHVISGLDWLKARHHSLRLSLGLRTTSSFLNVTEGFRSSGGRIRFRETSGEQNYDKERILVKEELLRENTSENRISTKGRSQQQRIQKRENLGKIGNLVKRISVKRISQKKVT